MFPQLLIGALAAGLPALGKSIFGAVQALNARKRAKKMVADRPKYNIPEEYMKSLNIYQNLAQGEMPGQRQYENLIGESTARAMAGAERGAISSNAYQGAVESAQDKELQALQQLALMGVQYKTQAQQNLAGAQTQMGQLKDVQWQTNVMQPWEIQKNIETEQRQAGMQNLFGGLGEIGSAVQNLVGTKYYTDVLKGLYSQGNVPKPIGTSGATQNLMNTASGMLQKTPINFPTQYDSYMEWLKKQGTNPYL